MDKNVDAVAADFPLPLADLESLGFRRGQIDLLCSLIDRHIAEGRYPGRQIALARHGRLALARSFGGLGGFANPRVFGHGGVGTSYCWGDPDSGVSFAYLTNNRIPDPWHSRRLDQVANLVHTATLQTP